MFRGGWGQCSESRQPLGARLMYLGTTLGNRVDTLRISSLAAVAEKARTALKAGAGEGVIS